MLPAISEPQDKLDQPHAVANMVSKNNKYQLDIQVNSETKLLKIEVSKCEDRSR